MTDREALELEHGTMVMYHGDPYVVMYARVEKKGVRIKLINGAWTFSVKSSEIEIKR